MIKINNILPKEREYPDKEKQELLPIPSPEMMFLVSGPNLRDNPKMFLSAGRNAHSKILDALEYSGLNIKDYKNILDWGCGCGRITRHWLSFTDKHKIHGCDVNKQMIEWCKSNIDFIDFEFTGLVPPLPYSDESMDFIYGTSVITHLSLMSQIKWMRELWRILKPGGIILLTFQGPRRIVDQIKKKNVSIYFIDEEIFLSMPGDKEGNNSYFSGQTIGALQKIFYPFEIICYWPVQLIMGGQDTVILKKNGDSKILNTPKEKYEFNVDIQETTEIFHIHFNGHKNICLFVRKNGDLSPLLLKIMILDSGENEICSGSMITTHCQENVYTTLNYEFPQPIKGNVTIRMEIIELNSPYKNKLKPKKKEDNSNIATLEHISVY